MSCRPPLPVVTKAAAGRGRKREEELAAYVDELIATAEASVKKWEKQLRHHETEVKVCREMIEEASFDLVAIQRVKVLTERILAEQENERRMSAMEAIAP